jgi:hypothetical protein
MSGLGGWSRYRGDQWKLSLDVFTQRHDQQTPILVTDAAGRSGYAQLGMEQNGFGIAYEHGGFELRGRYNHYLNDSAFGNLNVLPNPEGSLTQDSWYIEGKHTLALAPDLNLILKTSVMENTWRSDSEPLPDGSCYNPISGSIILCNTLPGYISFPNGYWASLMIKSRRISGGAALHYNGFDAHRLTAGVESTWNEAVDSYSVTTNKATGSGLVDYSDTPLAFIKAGNAKRQSTNLYLSDMITVNDAIAVALSVGQKRASDIESHTYGRAAIVYQLTRNDIVKIMAASGERYPSFQEMYLTPSPYGTGNGDLTYEHVRSVEAQYLRKLRSNLTAGLNFFYISNSQQIVRDPSGEFQNYGKSTIQGAEAELHGKLTPEDTLSLSYSYIHGTTEDNHNNKTPLPYTASHLIKAAYSCDLIDRWSAGGTWNYVGSKARYTPDTRDNLSSYNTLDLALGWDMDTHYGWYVQGIVKNIGDTTVRYPSPAATYPDDYPLFGRSFWVRAGWKF